MNIIYKISVFALIGIAFLGCQNDKKAPEESNKSGNLASDNATGVIILYKDGLTLKEIKSDDDFDNAKLKLLAPDLSKTIAEGKIKFDFETSEFDVEANGFINFSLNNALVKSYPSNSFDRNLPEGDFIFSSFLVNKKGISIKNENASLLELIKIGSFSDEEIIFEKDSSHLVYNKPQGVYKGAARDNVILDFSLINTKLSKKGKRVKAIINGTEFILDKWKAYLIEGLPNGENTIKIDLVNDLGVIPGPFNRGEVRVITLLDE